MNFEEKYPHLDSIFGFLNQDWHHIYKWEHRKPQYQPVIRLAKKAESDELTHQAIMELRELLNFGENFDDEQWYDFFMNK